MYKIINILKNDTYWYNRCHFFRFKKKLFFILKNMARVASIKQQVFDTTPFIEGRTIEPEEGILDWIKTLPQEQKDGDRFYFKGNEFKDFDRNIFFLLNLISINYGINYHEKIEVMIYPPSNEKDATHIIDKGRNGVYDRVILSLFFI